jgi:quercetin dioxygenase-like cupin family protein
MSAKPYHVKAGSGRTYDVGIPITVKAGERGTGNGAAVIEFEARRGEEPGQHSHDTEDEMFYVLEGRITLKCGRKTFEASKGDFVFLPKGVPHDYEIHGNKPVRLLVITSPPRKNAKGWRGFVGDFESDGG